MGSWAGLGAALANLRRQILESSAWDALGGIIAIVVYLTCISVSHITASSLLSIQPFNLTDSTIVHTIAGMPVFNTS